MNKYNYNNKKEKLNFCKIFLLCIGFLSVIVGTIGIVLPILPTMPFYLLATLCFTKISKRFYLWFTQTKLYKKYLDNFVVDREMTLKRKILIFVPVCTLLIFIMISFNN